MDAQRLRDAVVTTCLPIKIEQIQSGPGSKLDVAVTLFRVESQLSKAILDYSSGYKTSNFRRTACIPRRP